LVVAVLVVQTPVLIIVFVEQVVLIPYSAQLPLLEVVVAVVNLPLLCPH
jgi:hypothetical protein